MTREEKKEGLMYTQKMYFEKVYPNFKFILKVSSSEETSDLFCVDNTMGVKTTIKVQYNNNRSKVVQLGNYFIFSKNTPLEDWELRTKKMVDEIIKSIKCGWFKVGVKRKKYYDEFFEIWDYDYVTFKKVYFKKWEFVK